MKQRLNENIERNESELLAFIKAKDLSACILLISGKSPVKYRQGCIMFRNLSIRCHLRKNGVCLKYIQGYYNFCKKA